MYDPVPIRKQNRLPDYDYRQGGAYFVTICAAYKRCLFGLVVDGEDEPVMRLNQTGQLVDRAIRGIPAHYPTVSLIRHCVMPNHVHLLLSFDTERENPALSTVVNQMKGAATIAIGSAVWQKGFHDHDVRTEAEYRMIGEYIEHNAAKWRSDTYYTGPEDEK